MAFGTGAGIRLSCSLAGPVGTAQTACPRASTTRWRFMPGLPRSVGLGRRPDPPSGGHAGAVERRPQIVRNKGSGHTARNASAQVSSGAPRGKPSPLRASSLGDVTRAR